MIDVSVIIPSYAPEYYIQECLDSVFHQSLQSLKIEVLIVLNGDKEPYYSNIKNIIKDYPKYFKLYYIEDKGVSYARNFALNIAKGKYICFIDDDDIISNNYIYNSHQLIKDKEDAIVVANVRTFSDSLNNLGDDYLTLKDSSKLLLTDKFKYRKYFSSSCCKLIPRALISNNRFNTKFEIGEDCIFMFSISDKINSIILSSYDTIYYRRLRIGSSSRKNDSLNNKYLRYWNTIIEYVHIYNPFRHNLWLFLSRLFYPCLFLIKNFIPYLLKR